MLEIPLIQIPGFHYGIWMVQSSVVAVWSFGLESFHTILDHYHYNIYQENSTGCTFSQWIRTSARK